MTSLKDYLYVRKYVCKYQSDSQKDLAVLKKSNVPYNSNKIRKQSSYTRPLLYVQVICALSKSHPRSKFRLINAKARSLWIQFRKMKILRSLIMYIYRHWQTVQCMLRMSGSKNYQSCSQIHIMIDISNILNFTLINNFKLYVHFVHHLTIYLDFMLFLR